MSHRVTGAVAEAAESTTPRPVALVFLDFQSDPVYANSASFPITWDENTYVGVTVTDSSGKTGAVAGIGPIEEAVESKSSSVTLKLSGVSQELIGKAIGDRFQGRTGRIMTALLDAAYEVIGEPVVVFEGPIDAMSIKVADGQATITVTIADGRADWDRPSLRQYTNEDQQADFPGDKGFEFVPQMVEKNIVWGR